MGVGGGGAVLSTLPGKGSSVLSGRGEVHHSSALERLEKGVVCGSCA